MGTLIWWSPDTSSSEREPASSTSSHSMICRQRVSWFSPISTATAVTTSSTAGDSCCLGSIPDTHGLGDPLCVVELRDGVDGLDDALEAVGHAEGGLEVPLDRGQAGAALDLDVAQGGGT